MNRYRLEYVLLGHTFNHGYGARYFPFLWLAKIWMVASMMEYGHVFQYRIKDLRSNRVVGL